MGKYNELGIKAEILAANFLENKQYEIIHQNYRYKHKEIDIIAKYNNIIVFVEVKARSCTNFGYPESFVDNHKKEHIKSAASYYMLQLPNLTPCRFDIISIQVNNNKQCKIEHFEDAFY